MGLFTFSNGEHQRKSNVAIAIAIAIAVCERSLSICSSLGANHRENNIRFFSKYNPVSLFDVSLEKILVISEIRITSTKQLFEFILISKSGSRITTHHNTLLDHILH